VSDMLRIAPDVKLGKDVVLAGFINLYGCEIGDGTKIGTFVEVQKNAKIGERCKISSHTFICEGVTIEDNVFIGHGVTFINDRRPRATNSRGGLMTQDEWILERTHVKKGASIGSGATILSSVTIGENALVGAGSVVTHDVPDNCIAVGNPARVRGYVDSSSSDGKPGAQMSVGNIIPFLDLVAQHRSLEHELVAAFAKVLQSAMFVGGQAVTYFEDEFARFCGTRHCVGVSSGTDALLYALIAAGVTPGDVVVTVPHTFIATTEAILQAGAEPAFVDIDEQNYTMSPERLREYLEEQCVMDEQGRLRTRISGKLVTAVVPVHLYGQTADMDPILECAERYNLLVIEDACQAHGAEYFSKKLGVWKRAGSLGHAAAFSFYPGKNLGACGEAGGITTDDENIAHVCKMLREHGQSKKYHHDIEGYNGRLDAVQAALLTVKLGHLAEWNDKRRQIAARYDAALASAKVDLVQPHQAPYSRSVYHLYVVRSQDRDGLRSRLEAAGIGTGIHYPIPLHLQVAYRGREYAKGDFPVTERVASEIVSLPMFPELTFEQQDRVVKLVAEHLGAALAPLVG
jgi:dTDP-4-amino-4,6-dideoxygalactose transaminase/acetyltransferase-like isoleucine patch superfamily enzyme